MVNSTNARHYVNIHEAMLLTGKSRATIYRWAENAKVNSVTISKIKYFDGLELVRTNSKQKPGRPRHAADGKKV